MFKSKINIILGILTVICIALLGVNLYLEQSNTVNVQFENFIITADKSVGWGSTIEDNGASVLTGKIGDDTVETFVLYKLEENNLTHAAFVESVLEDFKSGTRFKDIGTASFRYGYTTFNCKVADDDSDVEVRIYDTDTILVRNSTSDSKQNLITKIKRK